MSKLKNQILRLLEKQYRKGYQQGYYACLNDIVSKERIDNWRFEDTDMCIDPVTKKRYNSVERVTSEMTDNEYDLYLLLTK